MMKCKNIHPVGYSIIFTIDLHSYFSSIPFLFSSSSSSSSLSIADTSKNSRDNYTRIREKLTSQKKKKNFLLSIEH